MIKKNRNLLFVLSIPQYHIEIFPIIEHLSKDNFNISVIIGWNGDNNNRVKEIYKKLNCDVLQINKKFAYEMSKIKSKKEKIISESTAFNLFNFLSRIILFFKYIVYFFLLKKYIKNIFNHINPQIIFQGPFHSCATFDNVINFEALKRAVHNICLPVSAYAGKKNATFARHSNFQKGMLPNLLSKNYDIINKLFALFFKNWVYSFRGSDLFAFDPIRMFAAKLNLILEEDVWLKPSKNFDNIFVYNSFAKKMLYNDFPREKIIEIGIPTLDNSLKEFNKNNNKNVLIHLGLNSNSKFILYNVEPSYEHKYLDKEKHWEYFNNNLKIVSSMKYPVILSLHPLCKYKDYVFAEKKFNVRIEKKLKIHDLYPYAHVVISFPCSTNIFSIIFKSNLIIYDYQGMTKSNNFRKNEFKIPDSKIAYSPDTILYYLKKKISLPKTDPIVPPNNASMNVKKFILELFND